MDEICYKLLNVNNYGSLKHGDKLIIKTFIKTFNEPPFKAIFDEDNSEKDDSSIYEVSCIKDGIKYRYRSRQIEELYVHVDIVKLEERVVELEKALSVSTNELKLTNKLLDKTIKNLVSLYESLGKKNTF
jgi:hypothetical protein